MIPFHESQISLGVDEKAYWSWCGIEVQYDHFNGAMAKGTMIFVM